MPRYYEMLIRFHIFNISKRHALSHAHTLTLDSTYLDLMGLGGLSGGPILRGIWVRSGMKAIGVLDHIKYSM